MTDTYTLLPQNLVKESMYKTSIDGMYYIERPFHKDNRGFFSEVIKVPDLEELTGTPFSIKQVNHARSHTNVVRGIHAEGWNKYVFINSGTCFCAIVDVRPSSRTFGKKELFILGFGENELSGCLYLPSGVGNSLCVLEGPLDYVYLVDKLYKDRDPQGDMAISVFDPDINIPWPIPREQMIISERDTHTVTLREKYPEKFV